MADLSEAALAGSLARQKADLHGIVFVEANGLVELDAEASARTVGYYAFEKPGLTKRHADLRRHTHIAAVCDASFGAKNDAGKPYDQAALTGLIEYIRRKEVASVIEVEAQEYLGATLALESVGCKKNTAVVDRLHGGGLDDKLLIQSAPQFDPLAVESAQNSADLCGRLKRRPMKAAQVTICDAVRPVNSLQQPTSPSTYKPALGCIEWSRDAPESLRRLPSQSQKPVDGSVRVPESLTILHTAISPRGTASRAHLPRSRAAPPRPRGEERTVSPSPFQSRPNHRPISPRAFTSNVVMQPHQHLKEIDHSLTAADGQVLTMIECLIEGTPAEPSGPVFLLVHGFTGDRRIFTKGPLPAALLELGARVFVGELRGRTPATPGSEPASIETYLRLDCHAFLAFISALTGRGRVHFIGHSLGGLLGSHLARRRRIASLTTIGTPLSLPRFAAPIRILAPIASTTLRALPPSVRLPWHWLLGAVSRSLCASNSGWPRSEIQEWIGLVSTASADRETVKDVLENAHPESAALLLELLEMLSSGEITVDGGAALETLRASSIPIAAVVGTVDSLAPPYTVAGLRRGDHQGPRRVIAIHKSAHFDLPIVDDMHAVTQEIWEFLSASRAI